MKKRYLIIALLLLLAIIFELKNTVGLSGKAITTIQILYIIYEIVINVVPFLLLFFIIIPYFSLKNKGYRIILALLYGGTVYLLNSFKEAIFGNNVIYIDFSYAFVVTVMLFILFDSSMFLPRNSKEEMKSL